MAEYKVQFDVYEGPLDLLLYLVRKQEVDIYQVNLTQLAVEFIEYIELMRELDLDVAGEFLVMAATLMHIKSRELLPREKQDEKQEEEDEDDPRWELIRQLVEYKKFKDAAASLQAIEREQELTYPRNPGKPDLPPLEYEDKNPQVSVFDLLKAVNKVLARIQEKEASTRNIHQDQFSVSEKIQLIRDTIVTRNRIRFTELFQDMQTRQEVVCTFLAMLELIRLHVIKASQSEVFGEIDLEHRDPSDDEIEEADENEATDTELEYA